MQAWLNHALFSTSSSAHRDCAPSQDEWQPRGFHSKSRQNLLWKYRNHLRVGLTCQLSFHCLIYASEECLGKSFKLQFISKPHLVAGLRGVLCAPHHWWSKETKTLPWVRCPGLTWQRCPDISLSLVSLLGGSRSQDAFYEGGWSIYMGFSPFCHSSSEAVVTHR